MRDLLAAAAAGLIQGLTEFLPVSSSGHLLLWHRLTGWSASDELAFDVALHLATLVALLAYFWRDLGLLARGWLRQVVWREPNESARLGWWLMFGTVPAVLAGLAFDDLISTRLRDPRLTAAMLVAVGVLMLAVEAWARRTRRLGEVRAADAAVIGGAQALALVPGVSRSGITIIAGLARGLHHADAARVAFLLAIPVTAGAVAVKAPALAALASQQLLPLVVGFLAATLSGWWAIGWLLRLLPRATLRPFAIYRIIVGLLLLAALRSPV